MSPLPQISPSPSPPLHTLCTRLCRSFPVIRCRLKLLTNASRYRRNRVPFPKFGLSRIVQRTLHYSGCIERETSRGDCRTILKNFSRNRFEQCLINRDESLPLRKLIKCMDEREREINRPCNILIYHRHRVSTFRSRNFRIRKIGGFDWFLVFLETHCCG